MRLATGCGRNRDDAAGVARLHAREHAFDAQKCCSQVSLDGRAPAFFADVLERARRRKTAASAGHQNVNRSERSLDLLAHRLDLIELGDICYNLRGDSPLPLDVCVNGGDRVRVAAMYRDLCPSGGEQACDGGPNTARTSRDQGHLIFEVRHGYSPTESRNTAIDRSRRRVESLE